MKLEKTRFQLIQEFEDAPSEALFSQKVVAAIRDCSPATIERDRWAGTGVPFIRVNARCCRYRKADILAWLNKCRAVQSTTLADILDGGSHEAAAQ